MRRSLTLLLLALTVAGCRSSGAPSARPRSEATAPTAAAPTNMPVDTMLLTCDGKGVVRPAMIVTACADGSSRISQLTWTSFTATSAEATGTESSNNCDPNCAQGHFLKYPATFRFSNPVHLAQGWYFGTVTTTYSGKTPTGDRVSVNNDLAQLESSQSG